MKAKDETWSRKARRVLLCGKPNSGKTFSVRTCPGPIAYVSYPGELGTASVPVEAILAGGGKVFTWENTVGTIATDYMKVMGEINRLVADIIVGKHGQFKTFFGDGLHKFHAMCMAQVTSGLSEAGEPFVGFEYARGNKKFFNHLKAINGSSFENVFFTIWEGRDKDNPDENSFEASRHIAPELPGAAAIAIMGEFAVVVNCQTRFKGLQREFIAQTQPTSKVWAAGIKCHDEALLKRIPLFVPQEWTALLNLLDPPGAAAQGQKEVGA
jgi:hypothetical protein